MSFGAFVSHVTILLKGHSGPSVSHITFLLKGRLGPSLSHVIFLLKGHSGPSVSHVTFLASVASRFCWKVIRVPASVTLCFCWMVIRGPASFPIFEKDIDWPFCYMRKRYRPNLLQHEEKVLTNTSAIWGKGIDRPFCNCCSNRLSEHLLAQNLLHGFCSQVLYQKKTYHRGLQLQKKRLEMFMD